MTVLDSSGAIDFLLGGEAFVQVGDLFAREGIMAVPDLLTFEVLAVFRRHVRRGTLDPERAGRAIEDLGDLPVDVFPSLPLRSKVWELRHNFTAADGFFLALAEQLGEPLATKDRALASAARSHTNIRLVELSASG